MEDLLYLSPKPERVQLQDRERPVNDSEERREALEPQGGGGSRGGDCGGESSDLWGGLWGLHYFGHLNFFPTHQSLIQVM